MKKLIAVIGVTAMLSLNVAKGQGIGETNTTAKPIQDIFAFLTTSSNLVIASYALYDTTTKEPGAGVAFEYLLNPYVGAVLRLDYLNKNIYDVQGNIQFQYPIAIGPVTFTPFAFAGVGTAVAGKGVRNGDPVAVASIGGAIKLFKQLDFIAGYERWTGGGYNDDVIGAGLAYHF